MGYRGGTLFTANGPPDRQYNTNGRGKRSRTRRRRRRRTSRHYLVTFPTCVPRNPSPLRYTFYVPDTYRYVVPSQKSSGVMVGRRACNTIITIIIVTIMVITTVTILVIMVIIVIVMVSSAVFSFLIFYFFFLSFRLRTVVSPC